MYIVSIRKEKGDRESEIKKWVRLYLSLRKRTEGLICFPGFLTKDKNDNMYDFWDKLLNGYNLNVTITQGMDRHALWEAHSRLIDSSRFPNLNYLDIDLLKKTDHSKIILFYRLSEQGKPNNKKSIAIKDFKDNYTVEAIMLGSSNQSHTCYFGSKAPYGESDVFLIASKYKKRGEITAKDFIADIADNNNRDTDNAFSDFRIDMDKCIIAKSIEKNTYKEDLITLGKIADSLLK